MKLRGIDFGRVFSTPGAFGFHGEGYWYHRLIELLGWSVSNVVTMVSKCVTLKPNSGNMPLRADFRPRELFPRCIIVDPIRCHTLNSVAWSNPGIATVLERGAWQNINEAFVVQLGAEQPKQQNRIREYALLAYALSEFLPSFNAPVAIQLAFGCCNVHLEGETVSPREIENAFDIFSYLNCPLIANFSPTVPHEWITAAATHKACDALWLTNTIPWGSPGIDWRRIYKSDVSPLERRGLPAGGYSGPAAFRLNLECLRRVKEMMLNGEIPDLPVVSGGAYSSKQLRELIDSGADAIAVGGTMRCRPWRTSRIVNLGNRHLAP